MAGARGLHGDGEGLVQRIHVSDHGVGRHDPEHAVGILLGGDQRGSGDGGGAIPAEWLQHEARGWYAGIA